MPEQAGPPTMLQPPDHIDHVHAHPPGLLARHASPLSLIVLGSVIAVALSGRVGSDQATMTFHETAVEVTVTLPPVVRAGQFFETLIDIEARAPIAQLTLAVPYDVWRDYTLNSMLPAAADEEGRDGQFVYHYGALKAGEHFQTKVDLQVNPDLHGVNAGAVQVRDGERLLASLPFRTRILP